MLVVLLFAVCSLITISVALGPPVFQLTPQGINVTIPATGYQRAAIHYRINEPLPGKTAANFSRDFYTYTLYGADHWSWLNHRAKAKEGDVIHYWIWGLKDNGEGETITDQTVRLGPMIGATTKMTTTSTSTLATTHQEMPTTTQTASTLTFQPMSTTSSSTGLGSKFGSTVNIIKGNNNINQSIAVENLNTNHSTTVGNSNHSTAGNNSNHSTAGGNSNHSTAGGNLNTNHSTTGGNLNTNHSTTGGNSSTKSGSVDSSTPKPVTSSTQSSSTSSNVEEHQSGYGSCCKREINCKSYPCLVFEDNFDKLNFCIWEHEITAGGKSESEFQYYTNNRTNSYVKNGTLFIKPTLTSEKYGEEFLMSGTLDLWGGFDNDACTSNGYSGCKRKGSLLHPINPVQSARLRSKKGFTLKYGKVEVEAKLPKGDWLWPAIKMLPRWNVYGSWPASGEIDVVESRGNMDYRDTNGNPKGVNTMSSSLHFGPSRNHDRFDKAHTEQSTSPHTFADSFHVFGVEWDETQISFTLDGNVILTTQPPQGGFWELGEFNKTNSGMTNPWHEAYGGSRMAPFDQEFFLVLDVAAGGTSYFLDTWMNFPYPKPWRDDIDFAVRDFWQARHLWYPTWNPDKNNGEDAALKINYVKVWKMKA